MIELSLKQLKTWLPSLRSEALDACRISGVQFDSREVSGGELFVALPGKNTNGQAYVEAAFERGASLALVEESPENREYKNREKILLVDNSLLAFQELARKWRQYCGAKVVAVTGSAGKTSVKDLLSCALSTVGRGIASQKSYNNHVGVPYTICQMSPGDDFAVLEMGMNHAGEISVLSKLGQPDLAIITKIAAAHIENLGSLENIAKAKLEILDGMSGQAPIILNGDDSLLCSHYKERNGVSERPTYFFGVGSHCQVKILSFAERGFEGIDVELDVFGERLALSMKLLGKHNAANAAAAVLAAKVLYPELSLKLVREAFSKLQPPPMRLNIEQLSDGRKLLDDSFNANPASWESFFEIAASFIAKGLKVGMLLGNMRELGSIALEQHQQINLALKRIKPAFVIAVGEFQEIVLEGLDAIAVPTMRPKSVEEAGEMAKSCTFDLLCAKAARGVKLELALEKVRGKQKND